MLKKIVFSLFFFLITLTANAHVAHYKDLKSLEFDLYRNNKLIGKHVYLFTQNSDNLVVNSKINFKIKKFGVTLYKYQAEGTEVYKNSKLLSFNSKTDQNNKKKYVNIEQKENKYFIDGSSYKGEAPTDYIVGTWWNHAIVQAQAQISAVSGRIIKQKVTYLGKETIEINGKKIETLHFNFSSTDKKLDKGKKLNTDVWYEEKSLYWVKASFNKQGLWEYRLKLAK